MELQFFRYFLVIVVSCEVWWISLLFSLYVFLFFFALSSLFCLVVLVVFLLNCVCISQAALTQLIQYYHRFQKILSQHPFKRLPIRSELINIHHVMVEVKKHKTTFWMIEELAQPLGVSLGFVAGQFTSVYGTSTKFSRFRSLPTSCNERWLHIERWDWIISLFPVLSERRMEERVRERR